MKKMTVIFMIAVVNAGCATMYGTPEERLAINRSASDYMLCERLTVAQLAPVEVRAEWALELQRRNVDCRQYTQMLNNAAAYQQNLMNYSARMLAPRPSDAPVIRSIQCHNTGVYTNCSGSGW